MQQSPPTLDAVLLSALERSPYGVMLLERRGPGDFVIRHANHAVRELDQVGDRQLVGLSLADFAPYITPGGVLRAAEDAFAAAGVVCHRTRLVDGGQVVHCHDDHFYRLPGTPLVALMYHDSTAPARAQEELRKLSLAIEHSIDGVALLGLDGAFQSANGAMGRLLGVEPAALRGRRLADFLDDKERERFLAPALDAVCLQGQHIGECTHRRGDGSTVPVRASLSLFRGADGETAGVVLIARNISEAREREERLRLLGTAVHEATDAVLITDGRIAPPGPRIRFVNEAFTVLTGYRAEEVIGHTPRMLEGPGTSQKAIAQLAQALRSDRPWQGAVVNYTKSGEPVHVEWHVAPVHDESGAISHFVGVLSDSTERERARQAESRSEQLAAIASTAITYNHEINNPLQAIVGHAELLARESLSAEARESLAEILQAAERIQDVLRRIDEVPAPNFVPYIKGKLMLDIGGPGGSKAG